MSSEQRGQDGEGGVYTHIAPPEGPPDFSDALSAQGAHMLLQCIDLHYAKALTLMYRLDEAKDIATSCGSMITSLLVSNSNLSILESIGKTAPSGGPKRQQHPTANVAENSLWIGDVLSLMADIHHCQGLHRQAQVYYSRASVIYSTEFGADHPLHLELCIKAANNLLLPGYIPQLQMEVPVLKAWYAKCECYPDINGSGGGSALLGDIMLLEGRLLYDAQQYQPAEALMQQAISVYKRAVGEESAKVAFALLHLSYSQSRQDELDNVRGHIQKAMTIARKTVEDDDNDAVGAKISIKDTHPLIADIMIAFADFLNPKLRPGKSNGEATRTLENDVFPLLDRVSGLGSSLWGLFVMGRVGVHKNLEKKSSGNEPVRDALAALEEGMAPMEEEAPPKGKGSDGGGGAGVSGALLAPLQFTENSRWVQALGGYHTYVDVVGGRGRGLYLYVYTVDMCVTIEILLCHISYSL